ncbi:hypothetical protein [Campylobacter jejuni]|uniref:hypothetical protein n=1 Tax=Campylobacter jejuni TaxID=197 RepID=UPI00129D4B1D|nr:hypothetical protein [Campylobacter jejuni]
MVILSFPFLKKGWFDNQFNQAKANGWKASSESINSFADSIADRLNNLIGQTRV